MGSRQFFDQVAGDWDQMRPGFYSDGVREKAFVLADIKDDALAADVGAGTGFLAEGLLQRGLRVVAVDQSEMMLELMRNKFASFEGIEYRKGDASRLPLGDQSVAYVFANMYLHHVESPALAIREMSRVLEVDGVLTITDVLSHPFGFLKDEHHDRWLGFRPEDVEGWFGAAGLREVTVTEIQEECRVRSINTGEEAVMSIFAARGRK